MIKLPLLEQNLMLRKQHEKVEVFDFIRKKWHLLTPEEHVRQAFLNYIINHLHYPKAKISVEKQIEINQMKKRFDIVVFNQNHLPYILVECKAPGISISENTLMQLMVYNQKLNCRYWILTNGIHTFCADTLNFDKIVWLEEIPIFEFN